MNNRSNLPRSATTAISWITARSLLLTAAPSQRQPAEWLPAPSTKTPRCIWRVARTRVILLLILDVAYPDKDERARFLKASGEILPLGIDGVAHPSAGCFASCPRDEVRYWGL